MNTGHKIVDEITQLKFDGNTIPNTWYCHIKYETKKKQIFKADILSINILADLIYWYRASEIREDETGKTIGYKKKFKADKYQKWYSAWAEKFGVTKRQIQTSMKILVDFGIVNREVTTLTTEQGLKLTGVTYFEPVVEKIKYINTPVAENHPPIYLQCNTPQQNKYDPPQKNVGGGTKKREDTETPTKNPTKNPTDTVGAKSDKKENSGKGKESVPDKPDKKESKSDNIGKDNPVSDTPYSLPSNPYTVSVDNPFLEDFIERNKEKDFRCVKLCETLLNRAESMEFPAKDNIGNVAKFADKLTRLNRKYEKGEISGALDLYQALPINSYHRQIMTEYINHEWQKWDFSKTKNENTVKGQFILEYILWHPVYAHFRSVKEQGLLFQDIANYTKRNQKPKNQEQPNEYWEVAPNHFEEEMTA